jgi:hypothetical protein
VPTKKPSRPLYEVFLERVIRIEAVQCYRAAVTEEHTADFFELGRIPGEIGTFRWSLEAPEPFPQGIVIADYEPPPMLPAMQAAWDAAVAAWKEFVGALRNGELIAVARHPATGEHHELDPAEWLRTGLVLDVRNGDLLEKERNKRELTERWLSIMLWPAEPKGEIKPGVIDWNDWWQHEVGRRERDELPPEKSYLSDAEALIRERYGVTHVPESGLRRLKAALYRGDVERPKR